jgi:hypothetical protein
MCLKSSSKSFLSHNVLQVDDWDENRRMHVLGDAFELISHDLAGPKSAFGR